MKSSNNSTAKGKTVHAKIQPVVVKHVIKEKAAPIVPTLPNLASIEVRLSLFLILIAWAKHSREGQCKILRHQC
jgi:hypothetical protein